jgi:hypothetical protein
MTNWDSRIVVWCYRGSVCWMKWDQVSIIKKGRFAGIHEFLTHITIFHKL